jgi:hypothetical protein
MAVMVSFLDFANGTQNCAGQPIEEGREKMEMIMEQ